MQIYDTKSKKTRKKLITQWINSPLIKLNSPLKKYYSNAYYCSHKLEQLGDSVSAKYCNCRTCITCNGIRTANYIKNYGEQVFELNKPQFVTLTAPTIWCTDVETLRYELNRREGIWRKIYKNADSSRNGKILLRGLKAMEVTVRPDDYYHPHFHFIIEGENEAEWLKSQWLKHFPDASPNQQVIKPLTSREGLLEVFKYGTKFSNKEKKLVNGKIIDVYKTVEPHRLDTVIQALYKKRLISTFGGVKRVKDEDVNDIVESVSIEDLEKAENRTWEWAFESDWYAQDTGEKFSEFVPSESLINAFAPNIKSN
jgi:Replication protein